MGGASKNEIPKAKNPSINSEYWRETIHLWCILRIPHVSKLPAGHVATSSFHWDGDRAETQHGNSTGIDWHQRLSVAFCWLCSTAEFQPENHDHHRFCHCYHHCHESHHCHYHHHYHCCCRRYHYPHNCHCHLFLSVSSVVHYYNFHRFCSQH